MTPRLLLLALVIGCGSEAGKASLCPGSLPDDGSYCPLPSINDQCLYPATPGCMQICSCSYPYGYWVCRSSCPSPPAPCPLTPPSEGDQCGTSGSCSWDQGCSLTSCRCMSFELGAPRTWYCSTVPNPDGGARRDATAAGSSCRDGG